MVVELHRATPNENRGRTLTNAGHAALKLRRGLASHQCGNQMLYWLMVRVVADQQLQKWAACFETRRWPVCREYLNSAMATNQVGSPVSRSFCAYNQFAVHSTDVG